MFQTFRNAWKIPELKNRLLFTLAILVVYRLGCAIPVPFVTSSALTQMFSNGNMLTYLDMMSGGALSRCTLFALGVTPYINASIIVQLLTVAIPSLENIAKEPDGQQKLQQITRYAGGIIALIMSLGYYFVVRNMGALKYTSGAAGIFTAVVIIATFTAGAQLITWCGEQIDDKGIGNGLSLLIFSSIVSNWSSLYTTVAGLLTRAAAGESQFYIFLPLLLVLALVVIVFIVIMTNAERRITIQYAKRVELLRELGKRCPVYLLSNTNLPHRIRFRESFRERFGGSFDELFVQCFYSDELHLRKPDPEIYRSVARQIGTPPGKLLFIDDNAANVSAARGEGWQACHLTGGITVTDLFEL